MRRVALISTTLLLGVTLSAAAIGSADAKHGKHGKHHGHGHAYVRYVPSPDYAYTASPVPVDTTPASAAIPHTEWCARTYQTYDFANDTFLRFDGVRVPCVGP